MRSKKILLFIGLDLIVLMLAVIISWNLRWDLTAFHLTDDLLLYFFFVIGSILTGFFIFQVYHCIWQYAGINDFLRIIAAVTGGTLIVLLLTWLFLPRTSGSLILTLWILLLLLLGGIRFIYRLTWNLTRNPAHLGPVRKTLIIGAGEAGALIIRTLKSSKTRIAMDVVGFIDDDPTKQGQYLYGIPIVGTTKNLPEMTKKFGVEEALITIPTGTPEQINQIARICQEAGIRPKILPSVLDMLEGKQLLNQIRDLQMEDLLHRNEIEIDLDQVARFFQDQVVLITGAGGSIGAELCRQIFSFSPSKLILLGRGENSINEIIIELTGTRRDVHCIPVIADIKDENSLSYVFQHHKPSVVFHAAAHKHVNLMEMFPDEAFKNNVFGTLNLVRMAHLHQVDKFVLISTDKAVLPKSVMGLTKLLGEMIARHYARFSSTVFTVVRFGNVLGSRGSVVQLFQKQISSGGPVTITHPEMRRYFMTIREAVQLVIEAGTLANGGEIFVLDMGEQVKIVDLAQDMIRFFGLHPGKDIKIKFVGIRPGEKLFEELYSKKENAFPTNHPKIFVIESGLIDRELIDIIMSIKGFPAPQQVERLKEKALSKYNLS